MQLVRDRLAEDRETYTSKSMRQTGFEPVSLQPRKRSGLGAQAGIPKFFFVPRRTKIKQSVASPSEGTFQAVGFRADRSDAWSAHFFNRDHCTGADGK